LLWFLQKPPLFARKIPPPGLGCVLGRSASRFPVVGFPRQETAFQDVQTRYARISAVIFLRRLGRQKLKTSAGCRIPVSRKLQALNLYIVTSLQCITEHASSKTHGRIVEVSANRRPLSCGQQMNAVAAAIQRKAVLLVHAMPLQHPGASIQGLAQSPRILVRKTAQRYGWSQ